MLSYHGSFFAALKNFQLLAQDTIVYFDGKKLQGAYDMKADPNLHHNVIGESYPKDKETFIKAYVQQYNMRMIGDSLTIGQ